MEKIAKTQLIELVAKQANLNKKQASEGIDALLLSVTEAIQRGNTVGLPGLGTFSVTETKERQAVRPGTTERITVPAGKKVTFKAASTLKSSLYGLPMVQ